MAKMHDSGYDNVEVLCFAIEHLLPSLFAFDSFINNTLTFVGYLIPNPSF